MKFKIYVLFFALLLALSGCDSSSSVNSRNYFIHETVSTKYFDVSVNQVLEGTVVNPNGLDRKEAPSGTKYIVLDVTIKNTSSEARIFDSGELHINIGGKDLKYDKSEIVLAKGFINFGNINPLISETGYIVFNVPESVGDENNIYWIPARSSEKIFLTEKKAVRQESSSQVSGSPTQNSESSKELIRIFPSFNCSAASTDTERSICSNPKLSLLDNLMVFSYKLDLKNSNDSVQIKTEQSNWRKSRDSCGSDTSCLTDSYNQKLSDVNSDTVKKFMLSNGWSLKSENWNGQRYCAQDFIQGSTISTISYFCAGNRYSDISLSN